MWAHRRRYKRLCGETKKLDPCHPDYKRIVSKERYIIGRLHGESSAD